MSTDESDEEEIGGEGKGEGGPEPYPYGKYAGGRDENLDRHGYGMAVLPNGDVYEGYYEHGRRQGKGMYVFKNGARYVGDYKKGVKYGKGEFIYPDGSKYVGDWKRDLKHGEGTYYYPNGDTYEGSWYHDFRHGLGTYYFKACDCIYRGLWKDGRMEGNGVLDYRAYVFHGNFEKNLPKGPGCFCFGRKFMQHGFYINIRDPQFDYVGADKLALEDIQDPDYRGNPPGIVPIWKAREVTVYKEELLPPEPQASVISESPRSSIDIVDYLEKYYKETGEEEEGKSPGRRAMAGGAEITMSGFEMSAQEQPTSTQGGIDVNIPENSKAQVTQSQGLNLPVKITNTQR